MTPAADASDAQSAATSAELDPGILFKLNPRRQERLDFRKLFAQSQKVSDFGVARVADPARRRAHSARTRRQQVATQSGKHCLVRALAAVATMRFARHGRLLSAPWIRTQGHTLFSTGERFVNRW